MYAHIAGIPVEETALSLAPVAMVLVVAAVAARDRALKFGRSLFVRRARVGSR
jgi:hypothetical protein